jgi:hypothetical protein
MKRSIFLAGGLAMLVLILAGAAFTAGRLLNDEPSASDPVVMDGPDGSRALIAKEPDIAYAEVMPSDPPQAVGLFSRREDNGLIIHSGSVTMSIHRDDRGNVDLETHGDGPELQVIVTHDTLIYRDDTFTQHAGEPASGPIQQVLETGTLDEIGEHTNIQAWGEKHGDRVVATVLLYTIPAVLSNR